MSKPKKIVLPYANTKVPYEDTIAEIKKLLKANGIQDVQDTTLQGQTVLKFIYHTKDRDVGFEIKPPTLSAQKKSWNQKSGKYETITFPMLNQAWRLVYWYLEIKFKAIRYGLVSLEREFLNQMLTSGEKTVGDIIIERMHKDQDVLKLESDESKVVDAQFQVVDKQ